VRRAYMSVFVPRVKFSRFTWKLKKLKLVPEPSAAINIQRLMFVLEYSKPPKEVRIDEVLLY
jgi:hypothetical protein